MNKILGLLFLSFSFLTTMSCEDDALLDPQDTETDGGSYGNLSLPGDSDKDFSKNKDNPEIF